MEDLRLKGADMPFDGKRMMFEASHRSRSRVGDFREPAPRSRIVANRFTLPVPHWHAILC